MPTIVTVVVFGIVTPPISLNLPLSCTYGLPGRTVHRRGEVLWNQIGWNAWTDVGTSEEFARLMFL